MANMIPKETAMNEARRAYMEDNNGTQLETEERSMINDTICYVAILGLIIFGTGLVASAAAGGNATNPSSNTTTTTTTTTGSSSSYPWYSSSSFVVMTAPPSITPTPTTTGPGTMETTATKATTPKTASSSSSSSTTTTATTMPTTTTPTSTTTTISTCPPNMMTSYCKDPNEACVVVHKVNNNNNNNEYNGNDAIFMCPCMLGFQRHPHNPGCIPVGAGVEQEEGESGQQEEENEENIIIMLRNRGINPLSRVDCEDDPSTTENECLIRLDGPCVAEQEGQTVGIIQQPQQQQQQQQGKNIYGLYLPSSSSSLSSEPFSKSCVGQGSTCLEQDENGVMLGTPSSPQHACYCVQDGTYVLDYEDCFHEITNNNNGNDAHGIGGILPATGGILGGNNNGSRIGNGRPESRLAGNCDGDDSTTVCTGTGSMCWPAGDGSNFHVCACGSFSGSGSQRQQEDMTNHGKTRPPFGGIFVVDDENCPENDEEEDTTNNTRRRRRRRTISKTTTAARNLRQRGEE